MNSLLSFSASPMAASVRGPKRGWAPSTWGRPESFSSASRRSTFSSAGGSQSRSARFSNPFESCLSMATSRSSGSTTPPLRAVAPAPDASSADQAFSVNCSARISPRFMATVRDARAARGAGRHRWRGDVKAPATATRMSVARTMLLASG